MVENLPAMWETWVQSVGSWEDPLEEGMATHSSISAWKIPWTEKPGGLQSMGLQRVRHDWSTKHRTSSFPSTISQKKLSFLHCLFLAPLLAINCMYLFLVFLFCSMIFVSGFFMAKLPYFGYFNFVIHFHIRNYGSSSYSFSRLLWLFGITCGFTCCLIILNIPMI